MSGFLSTRFKDSQRLRRFASNSVLYIAPPVATGPHRYWRILFSANAGSPSYDGIGEMEYRATVGGADQTVAQNPSPAVLASSEINAANLGLYAFTNDGGGNNWLSASAGASWLRYDFGSAVTVAQVSIMGPGNSITSSPKDFSIQYSDNDSAWTTALAVTGQTGWASGVARLFSL